MTSPTDELTVDHRLHRLDEEFTRSVAARTDVEAALRRVRVRMVAGPAQPPAPAAAPLPPEVVTAAVAGERAAVDRLLAYVHPLVVRYCRARVGRQERGHVSADDVAQEVCVAVITALGRYRDEGRPFLAFVYGIASHKVADAHRAAGRNRSEPMAELPDEAATTAGPEHEALRADLGRELNRLLAGLPDKQRDIVLLRVVVGLSAEETAEAVGSTPGAVRVAQHRALTRLRERVRRR